MIKWNIESKLRKKCYGRRKYLADESMELNGQLCDFNLAQYRRSWNGAVKACAQQSACFYKMGIAWTKLFLSQGKVMYYFVRLQKIIKINAQP